MAIIAEKKLVDGSYYNSTTAVFFYQQKIYLCPKRTTHSPKDKYLAWYNHGHNHWPFSITKKDNITILTF